jgi:hypothetical protein
MGIVESARTRPPTGPGRRGRAPSPPMPSATVSVGFEDHALMDEREAKLHDRAAARQDQAPDLHRERAAGPE